MAPSIEFVIARYNENLDWIQMLPTVDHIYIYNKGEAFDASAIHMDTPCSLHTRPNVGREAETWLHHICSNYENNNHDMVVFLQGRPFDHMHKVTATDNLLEIPKLCADAYTKNQIVVCCANAHRERPGTYGLPLDYYFRLILSYPSAPNPVFYATGAQYCVSWSRIRSRPLSFYKNLHEMVSKTEYDKQGLCHRPDAIDAWILERLWPYIWADK